MRSRKHHTRTSLAILASLAVLPLTLAACSPGSSSGTHASASATSSWGIPSRDPSTTIHVLSMLDPVKDNMQPVINAFEKAHPTIKVKWQTVPFPQLASTIDAEVGNKDGNPDIYWADQPTIAALASRGEAENLTSVFSKYRSDFVKTAYDAGLYNNGLYALPIANSSQVLLYNKDLLAKAGLSDPPASTNSRMTWEQLQSDAIKAHNAGAKYGFMFGQFDTYYQLEVLPVQLGGSIGAKGKGNLTPDITGPQWVKAFNWYHDLFTSGASPRGFSNSTATTDAAFVAGQTAYMVEGPWILSQLGNAGFKWGVAPQPVFAGAKPATPTGSWSLAMNPFSKNKDAAAIFLKFMAIDNGAGYTRYRPDAELPANINGQAMYFSKPVFATPAGRDAEQIMKYETSHTAINRVTTIGYPEFVSIVQQAFTDISNGQAAKQALDQASEQLTTAWQKYK